MSHIFYALQNIRDRYDAKNWISCCICPKMKYDLITLEHGNRLNDHQKKNICKYYSIFLSPILFHQILQFGSISGADSILRRNVLFIFKLNIDIQTYSDLFKNQNEKKIVINQMNERVSKSMYQIWEYFNNELAHKTTVRMTILSWCCASSCVYSFFLFVSLRCFFALEVVKKFVLKWTNSAHVSVT